MRPFLRRATPERVAVVVWTAVCVALVVKNAVAPNSHSLYPQYAQAARVLAGETAVGSIYCIQHLPIFADLLYPFSRFPDRVGSVLWLLLSLAVLLSGLRTFIARFSADNGSSRPWIFLVVLVIGLGSLANNQSNILITGCLLWGAVSIRDGRWWPAAMWLAAPGFKMYPLALGLLYAALFTRRFAWRFACAVGIILAAPYLIHPPAVVSASYAGVFDYVVGSPHSRTYVLMNVRDFLVRWGWLIEPRWFLAVQALTGVAILGVVARLCRRGGSDDQIVWHGFVLTSLWFVTFGPSVESQTFILAAPALAWIFVETWKRSRTSAAAVACTAALAVIGPLQTSLFGLAAQRAVVGAKVVCPVLVAVWGWQLIATFRKGNTEAPTSVIKTQLESVKEWPVARAA